MCKIIAFSDMSKINIKKHVNDIGNTLLKLEKDGFGYAIRGTKEVYGEKSIDKTFRTRVGLKELGMPFLKKKYTRFGLKSEATGPGLFHGRSSTNVISLVDTHPMQRNGWNLIHNGVVTDYGLKYAKETSNDSEDLLIRLMEGISSVESNLGGYYAFAAIDPQGRLHICRDSLATLYMAWSEVYKTYIFATTESLLLKMNKMLSAKLGPIDELADDVYLIYKGNELVHSSYIKPRGYTVKESRHATTSLGRNLDGMPVSESDWHRSDDEWNGVLNSIAAPHTDVYSSDAYKEYRDEVDNMDASYTIYDSDDNKISVWEFKKLDQIGQESCDITRADGTVVDIDARNLRLRA